MKEYTFSVMVALTYWSIDIEVPIVLTDEEVNKIKTIVAQADGLENQNDEDAFEGELEDEDVLTTTQRKACCPFSKTMTKHFSRNSGTMRFSLVYL